MPIYEFECPVCGTIDEVLVTREGTKTALANGKFIKVCSWCGHNTWRIMSTGNFRVTGANAKNGYSSIPTYDEVVDENGYQKEKWGK